MFSTLDMQAVTRMFVCIKQVLWLVDRKFSSSYERVKVLYFCKLNLGDCLIFWLNTQVQYTEILVQCLIFITFLQGCQVSYYFWWYIFSHIQDWCPGCELLALMTQSAITCSKLTIEALEQVVKHLQS